MEEGKKSSDHINISEALKRKGKGRNSCLVYPVHLFFWFRGRVEIHEKREMRTGDLWKEMSPKNHNLKYISDSTKNESLENENAKPKKYAIQKTKTNEETKGRDTTRWKPEMYRKRWVPEMTNQKKVIHSRKQNCVKMKILKNYQQYIKKEEKQRLHDMRTVDVWKKWVPDITNQKKVTHWKNERNRWKYEIKRIHSAEKY